MHDPTDKIWYMRSFQHHYLKLVIFSLCGCRHLSSYLTLWNTGMCVRFVVCCGWHLNDLSNFIKIDTVIPFSLLDCTIHCMESVIFSLPFLHLFIFYPQGLLTQEFLRTCPDFSLLTGTQHHRQVHDIIFPTGCCSNLKTFKIMNTEDWEIQQKPTKAAQLKLASLHIVTYQNLVIFYCMDYFLQLLFFWQLIFRI